MTFADGSGSDNSSSDSSASGGDFDLTLYLEPGDSLLLGATSGSKDVSVKWSTSDKKVVTVNSKGKIKAKKEGTAIITAKSGSTTKTIKIIVED